MRNIIRTELKKAIRNKYFIIALMIGIIISMLSLNVFINERKEFISHWKFANTNNDNPLFEIYSVFNNWISASAHSFATTLYFYSFPILITIPFGWSYISERKNKYMCQEISRVGRFKYMFAKYLATFITGGLVMVIPLIINFLIATMFYPVVTPYITYATHTYVFYSSMFSTIYYTHPFIYTILYLLVDFMFAGALSCITIITGRFIKFKWLNCLVPFVICILLSLLPAVRIIENSYSEFSLAPTEFLRCKLTQIADAYFPIILGMFIFIILFAIIFTFVTERKHEIY